MTRLPRSERSMRTSLITVVILAATVMFFRLGAAPVTRNSEDRCLDVAQNMIASGEYLVPVRDDEARLQKPPLYYWLSVGSAHVAGGLTNATLRLPSAVAAMLLLLVVALWGNSLGGRRLALASSASLAGMIQFYAMGRQGTAEMTLALASTLALMLYETGLRTRGQPSRPAVAMATGFAFLAKATTGLLTVALPILVDLAVRKKLRAAVRRPVIAWSLVAVAIGAAWYVYVLSTVPGAFGRLLSDVARPFGIDAGEGGGAEHYRAPWFYVDKVVLAALPASLLLPVAFWVARRSRLYRDEPGLRFLALSFVTLFVGFSLLPQKQKHYILQALPVLSILIGHAALVWWDEGRTSLLRWLRPTGVFLAVAGLLILAFMSLFLHIFGGISGVESIGIAALLASLIGAGAFALRRQARPFLATFGCAWFGLILGFYGELRPWREQIKFADHNDQPLPNEIELIRVLEEHPAVIKILGVEDEIESRIESQPK